MDPKQGRNARHVLPNILATYIVLMTVNVSYAIVVEASLSFLGLGATPDEPSWGAMLTAGTQAMESAPWLFLFPKATFDRILRPDFESPKCGAMLEPLVASVETPDPQTVPFELTFATASFVPGIASAWCRIAQQYLHDGMARGTLTAARGRARPPRGRMAECDRQWEVRRGRH